MSIPDGVYNLEYLINAQGGLGPSLEISGRIKYEISSSTYGEPASDQVTAEVNAMDAAAAAFKATIEAAFPQGTCQVTPIRYTRSTDPVLP
jgi:hypothetical protein